ncbi:MAG: DUF11 domain-containing protein [Chloroflexota bacterium]
MKLKMMQLSLVASTTLLLLVVLTPGYTTQGYAAVLANITSTPTEPAPPTETPAPPTATPTRPTEVPPTVTPPPGQPTTTPSDPTTVPPDVTATPEQPVGPATTTPRRDDDDDDGGSPPATPEIPTPTLLPTATPTITPTGDLFADPAVSKSISQSEANPGDEVTYTINVVNRGNIAAENVVVTDSLPDELTIVDMSTSRGEASMRGQTISVTIGLMEPGEEVTIRIRARVKADTPPSTISNGVVVTTTSPGDDPSNNTASVPLTIIGTAVLPAALPQTGVANEIVWLIIATVGLLFVLASLVLRRQMFR